jgi:dGTPase
VLYSSAFRRLASVTQTVGVHEAHLFHNRLTHSLKVSQVAGSIAQKLLQTTAEDLIFKAGGIDIDVAEAAGLAHDLGHPPFGHIAEQELQMQLRGELRDSFEGNAQSFRIVTKLARRSTIVKEQALNLTRATRRAILKYPWILRDGDKKWGAYDTEKFDLDEAREGQPPALPSAEARIMDIADDITYAVHDLEDFYRSGLIPLDRLAHDQAEGNNFLSYASAKLSEQGFEPRLCASLFTNLQELVFPKSRYLGTPSDKGSLHMMATQFISKYLQAITIRGDGTLWLDRTAETEIALLKQLTWCYVIDNPILASIQQGQREIVKNLFRRLREWAAAKKERSRLPYPLGIALENIHLDPDAGPSGMSDEKLRLRAVVDYIAGLTERQAMSLHERLTGASMASVTEQGIW